MLYTEKTISSFPVAIGTSLSLESVFEGRLSPYDASREIPNKVNIAHYSESWFNLTTLFRNLIGALPNDAIFNTTPDGLARDLYEEIEVIESLHLNEGNNVCKPFFYVGTYNRVVSKYSNKKVIFRQSNTDKQKLYESKLKETIKLFSKYYPEKLVTIDSSIKPKTPAANAIIMSHIPYDLVSHSNFKRFDLLESHTGKLKTKYEFSGKYQPLGSETMDQLPFLEKLLMVFGDKIMIVPADIRIRRLLLEIAKNREWTPYTTEAKVNYFIDADIKEPYLKQWLLSL